MAYDKDFAYKLRAMLGDLPGLTEKKMFGGVGYLINGNMALGVLGSDLIVRFGPERQSEISAKPHTHPFDMTGRAMKGWIMVSPAGLELEQDLKNWMELGIQYASTLPAK